MDDTIDTDLVRFEHDECENADIVAELCDEIERLRFQIVLLEAGPEWSSS